MLGFSLTKILFTALVVLLVVVGTLVVGTLVVERLVGSGAVGLSPQAETPIMLPKHRLTTSPRLQNRQVCGDLDITHHRSRCAE